MSTHIENKVNILAEMWETYRDDFSDFCEYNEVALTLSRDVRYRYAMPTLEGEQFIEESFDLLLISFGLQDIGFETIEDVFKAYDQKRVA